MINNALKERMEALLNSREDWTVDELHQELEKISAEGPMPLTSKGNLKVSFIKELYNLGIYYGYDRDSFEKR
ncbi:MAG: hypothetical protein KBG82_08885, partial [Spirochaetes bacterium]|nr:hypothetical protein [Spirochaetota bacterium]